METFLLTLGFVAFAAATAYFIYESTRAPQGNRVFHIITAVITGWAGFSYLMMATGAGSVLLEGGRIFYYFRYIDWVITTPLLLIDLALLALVDWRRNVNFIATILALDVVMILTGLAAGSSEPGFFRVFWFLVSTAAFVGVLYLLLTTMFREASRQPGSVQQLFRTLAVLTAVLWTLYPIVFLLGTEGFGAFGSSTEVFFYLVLDLLAKIAFGVLLLTNREALGQAASTSAGARPSRVA